MFHYDIIYSSYLKSDTFYVHYCSERNKFLLLETSSLLRTDDFNDVINFYKNHLCTPEPSSMFIKKYPEFSKMLDNIWEQYKDVL